MAKSKAKTRAKSKARKAAPGSIKVLYEGLTADMKIYEKGDIEQKPGPQLTAVATEKRTYRGKLGARFLGQKAAKEE